MEILVKINGIQCGGCLTRIEKRLNELEVGDYDLDLKTKIAKITYEPNAYINSKVLCENIDHLGFKTELLVEIK